MGIDTSIYSNLLRAPKSIAEYDAEAMQGQQNKLALQMNRAKMDEYQRGADQENALAQAYREAVGADGATDRNKLYTGVAQAGAGAKLPGIQKSYADMDSAAAKESRDQEKFKIESQFEKYKLSGQIMNGVRDQASWERAKQQAAQMFGPEVAAQMPDVYDPRLVAEKQAQAMSAKEQLEQEWKSNGFDLDVQKFGEIVRNNKAQTAVSEANNKRSVGASYANAAATRSIASATRDAASIRRDQETEMKLGDDYRKQSKDFKDIGDAYRTINATLDNATKSPAATLAGATKFMKLLDPGSVVRESELGMALAASGILDRATNYFNVLQSGRVLTPNQVKDFKKITKDIYAEAQAGQRDIDASYTKQAKQYKLRPEMIVQDLGQNAKPNNAPDPKGAKFLGFE